MALSLYSCRRLTLCESTRLNSYCFFRGGGGGGGAGSVKHLLHKSEDELSNSAQLTSNLEMMSEKMPKKASVLVDLPSSPK